MKTPRMISRARHIGLASIALLIGGAVEADSLGDWNAEKIHDLASYCSNAILTGAENGYYKEAKRDGNASPEPFPHAELVGPIKDLCSCVSERTAEQYSYAAFTQSGGQQFMHVFDSSVSSGACKPEGLLAEFMGAE